jgi:hypothetical protein
MRYRSVAPEGLSTKVTIFGLKCVTTPPQTIKHAARYVDLGGGKVEIQTTAHGIESITEGECKNKEGVGEDQKHNNGVYAGNVTVTAKSGVSLAAT